MSKTRRPAEPVEVSKAEQQARAAERAYYAAETARLKAEALERESRARGRRTYDITTEVTSEVAADVFDALSSWAYESDDAILLRIMTPGGDEIAGLAIVDFVRNLRAEGVPIDTLALGWAASMGSVLLQAGEHRWVAPHAVLLIHEGRTFAEDAPPVEKLSDMRARMRLGQLMEDACNELLAERSVFGSAEELATAYGSADWWLTADEAVELGFADEVWPTC